VWFFGSASTDGMTERQVFDGDDILLITFTGREETTRIYQGN
jgi:hypothetical protein